MQAVITPSIRSMSMIDLNDKKQYPKKTYLGMKIEHVEIEANLKGHIINNYPLNTDNGKALICKSLFNRFPIIIKSTAIEKEVMFYAKYKKLDEANIKHCHLNKGYNCLDIFINQSTHMKSWAYFHFDIESKDLQLYNLKACPRRRRIGSLLLYAGAIFAQQQKIAKVTVRTAIQSAYPFYKQFGFQDPYYNYKHLYSDLETDTESLLSKTWQMIDGFSVCQILEQTMPPCVKRWKSEVSIRS